MGGPDMPKDKLHETVPVDLLYQALETEKGGVQIYSTALRCVINKDLKEEWNKYLEQTKTHVQVVTDILRELGLDPNAETPGRKVVRYVGTSLVKAMELALRSADPEAAQIVAAECVVLAETKDHLNWELIGELVKSGDAAVLKPAYEQVEEEEDEHLYHTTGWTRELWIQALGMPAVLPPPEEVKKVETAIEAAKAKQSRAPKAKAQKAGAR
jgi:rubrerythrin